MLVKASELSRGDKLWLDRRRRRENQATAAKRHRVSIVLYRSWERDDEHGPSVKVGKLAPHEECALVRREEEVTIAEVAEELGCCRYWVHKMEKGEVDPQDLLDYWAA